MFLRNWIAALVLTAVSFGAQADVIYDLTNSIKSGAVTFIKIDRLALTGEGQLRFSESDDRVQFDGIFGTDWTANFALVKSTDFGPYTPRCTGGGMCDITNWYFLGLDTTAESTITKSDGRKYVIHDAWGQFGYNAGGIKVAANDGFATGIWLKQWTEYNPDGTVDHVGRYGDINAYANAVPEPNALALLGIGIFGMLWARRRAA